MPWHQALGLAYDDLFHVPFRRKRDLHPGRIYTDSTSWVSRWIGNGHLSLPICLGNHSIQGVPRDTRDMNREGVVSFLVSVDATGLELFRNQHCCWLC